MFEPNSVYAKIAYDAILLHVKANTKLKKKESEIPQALKLKLGCYVTIYDSEGNIKGQAGNTDPKNKYLFHEIIENAINAAQDKANDGPVKESDLSNIIVEVDILSQPKPIEDTNALKPHKHGIIVENEEGAKSLLFPNMDGIETPEQLMDKAREKAGIPKGENPEEIKFYHFTTTKYK